MSLATCSANSGRSRTATKVRRGRKRRAAKHSQKDDHHQTLHPYSVPRRPERSTAGPDKLAAHVDKQTTRAVQKGHLRKCCFFHHSVKLAHPSFDCLGSMRHEKCACANPFMTTESSPRSESDLRILNEAENSKITHTMSFTIAKASERRFSHRCVMGHVIQLRRTSSRSPP